MAPESRPGALPIQSPPPGSPPYSPYPPYSPPGPPYYPPPKSSNVLVIVVVVILIIVVIAVVLAAALFILLGGLFTGGSSPRPVVSFGSVSLAGSEASFFVVAVSQSAATSSFRVNLFVNTTLGIPQPLGPSFTIPVGPDTFPGGFTDLDGDGLVTSGDGFRVTAPGGWRPGTTYQFELLWLDDSPVAFRSWTT